MFNGFDISTIQDAKFGNSQVSSIYYGANLIWPTGHDYSRDYLTLEAVGNTSFWFIARDDVNHSRTIYFSVDDGQTWTQTTSTSSATPFVTINAGEHILLKGNNMTYADYNSSTTSYDENMFSTTSGQFIAYGNIMSLVYGDNFIGQNTLTGDHNFSMLFSTNNFMNAENLILPATTLTPYCYSGMFNGAVGLSNAPKLPATTLAPYCYSLMFSHCTYNLITAPELPATTLAEGCYSGMFDTCQYLTTAPELPATTLVDWCYNSMFISCKSLNNIKMLATDVSANRCLNYWVYDVSSTGTFTKKSSTTLPRGDAGIPSGWTVINI